MRSHEQRLPALILTDQPAQRSEQAQRGWPESPQKYQLKDGKLSATTGEGSPLWTVQVGSEAAKIVSQPPRVLVIDAKQVRVLDQDSGRQLHQWPSLVPLSLAEEPNGLSLWTQPKSIMGGDQEHLFVKAGRWLCVLRQKDGRGWAVYYSARMKAKLSEDGNVLVTEGRHSMVTAWRMADHKPLWEYSARGDTQVHLVDVTATEVLISIPWMGRLVGLDRQTGQKLWTRSHALRCGGDRCHH